MLNRRAIILPVGITWLLCQSATALVTPHLTPAASAVFAPGLFKNRNAHSSPTILFAGNDDKSDSDDVGGPLSFLFNPYESKIPEELRKEIYDAEANTPAAKERTGRVALYAVIALVGVLCAFFNGFLTELRDPEYLPEGTTDPLGTAGFSWVESNFLFQFLFLNKIGGGICLLGGAGAGLLAEAELDTKRINAEKIFEEMERRRLKKESKGQPKAQKKGKKRRSGKEKKRLEALSELTVVDEPPNETAPPEEAPQSTTKKDKGLLGKVKGFYEKADTMAASQALLLNKELEDRGLIEKITDESGLKVIGREEAASLDKEKGDEKK